MTALIDDWQGGTIASGYEYDRHELAEIAAKTTVADILNKESEDESDS